MSNASPPNKSPAVAVSAATGGRLVGVGGLFNNHEWLIQRTPFTFGRLSTSDVNLDHEVGASRSHAEIHADGSQYTILDKSSNGTIVNGTRIPKGIVQPLRHNDVITICNTSFKFKHEVGSGSADGLEEAPEPTSIFHMSSLPSAPLSAPLSAPPTIPPPSSKNDDAVFSLDAMDMMARAARAEAEATEAKARADREVARLRAEAEAAREESRRIRRSVEEANEAKARAEAEAKALLEAEMARQQAAFEAVRQKIEAEVRARAEAELARVRAEAEAAKQLVEAEIRARAEIEAKARAALEARAEVEAKARAVLEARSVADRQELERLRAESIRMSSVPARVATAPPRPAVPPTAVAPQPDPFAAVVARAAAGPGALASSGAPAPAATAGAGAPPTATAAAPGAGTTPPGAGTTPPGAGTPPAAGGVGQPSIPVASARFSPSGNPRLGTRLMPGSLRTTPANAAYRFGLGDNVILVLSSDNLRGETLCTSARLVGIEENGELTIDCVDVVPATRWDQKPVMIGKNPHNGSLLVAETRILSIEETEYNTVHLSTTSGRLTTVQLRSSVRQRAIPEVQSFTRFDGGVARLIDYSIGGIGLAVPRNDPRKRGDVMVGTLQLKRSLVFEVTLEVRGRERLVDSPDEDLLNCRFSTREMDPEVLRKISMSVLYRR